jgi:hypothetical protein
MLIGEYINDRLRHYEERFAFITRSKTVRIKDEN